MGEPARHNGCRELVQWWSDKIAKSGDGAQVHATAVDPGDPEIDSLRCPHGVRYFLVPADGSE